MININIKETIMLIVAVACFGGAMWGFTFTYMNNYHPIIYVISTVFIGAGHIMMVKSNKPQQ